MSRATLKQVAQVAGVSYQTVSKVVNRGLRVSKEVEDRIWDAVATLSYQPNHLARALRFRRSNMIGYSWEPSAPDHTNPILDQFLQSMASAAEDGGYHLLAFPFRPGQQWIESYRALIDTNRVDAFVISSVEFDDPRIAFLVERNFPFVAFGRSNPEWDFPFVDVDGAAGMVQVVEHLAAQGHRRIAALAWPEGSRVGQNRMEGFYRGLEAAGLDVEPGLIARGEGVVAFGRQAALALLDLPAGQRPTAIVAFNDMMAIGALQAAAECGLRVGEDLAVTGFDDIPFTQHLTPPLTSVHQPIWEVGQQIFGILLDLLNQRQPAASHVLLAPRLVVRQSSLAV